MQSVDPHTLKSIKRDNISTEDYEELQKDLQVMELQHIPNLFLLYQVTHILHLLMVYPM